MKILDIYYHSDSQVLYEQKYHVIVDIISAINLCPVKFSKSAPSIIKTTINKQLRLFGWTDNVPIDPRLNLTINYMKQDIGFILQLGNVARTYADLVKLNYLGSKGVISLAVIAVACKHEANLLGANYAYFERLVNEVNIFKSLFLTPLVVYGLGN